MSVALSVSEFVSLTNQTFDYAFPGVIIQGELANLRVSKNKWVYFDLKDERCSVKFFGTVHMLPGPMEDGMLLSVRGTPHLHNVYGFSVNVQTITLTGKGTIRKAQELLFRQLQAEGLFVADRKRPLPYPPASIGLITSAQSAAYADFTKILSARWSGIAISLIDTQVQGEAAPAQLIAAVEHFNTMAHPPEVLVMIRGGGSADDLAAFNTEGVTRAIAASRIPTLVAIGHEIDESLAELAADQRASTPSNAAELLVPDKKTTLAEFIDIRRSLQQLVSESLAERHGVLAAGREDLQAALSHIIGHHRQRIAAHSQLLNALDPEAVLRRGYAVIRRDGKAVRSVQDIGKGEHVSLQLSDGLAEAIIEEA